MGDLPPPPPLGKDFCIYNFKGARQKVCVFCISQTENRQNDLKRKKNIFYLALNIFQRRLRIYVSFGFFKGPTTYDVGGGGVAYGGPLIKNTFFYGNNVTIKREWAQWDNSHRSFSLFC